MFGKEAKKKQLISQLPLLFARIQLEHHIPAGDFPDCARMQVGAGMGGRHPAGSGGVSIGMLIPVLGGAEPRGRFIGIFPALHRDPEPNSLLYRDIPASPSGSGPQFPAFYRDIPCHLSRYSLPSIGIFPTLH